MRPLSISAAIRSYSDFELGDVMEGDFNCDCNSGDGSHKFDCASLRAPEKDTGGAAFPSAPLYDGNGCGIVDGWSGMTMRDYFAAHAIAGIIQADGAQFFASTEAHALIAYEHADAMIAERSKP